MHGNTQNLEGQRFDRLLVVKEVEDDKPGAYWECLCDCGGSKVVRGTTLKHGKIRSCGCLRTDSNRKQKHRLVHGQSNSTNGKKMTREYSMLLSSRRRAKHDGIPHNLELSDIVIPEFCPVFTNVRLSRDNKKVGYDSPSLDKLKPELGYVRGNVRVISWRANTIKQDASVEELRRVAEWLEGELR